LCDFDAQNWPKKMLYIDSQMIKRSTWGNKKRKALKRNENKIRL